MTRKRNRKSADTTSKPPAKEKFLAVAREVIKHKPVVPLNSRQEEYFEAIKTKDLIVVTGYAGTSKTFVACSLAADAYKAGEINRIVLARPAMSHSKSLGFNKGTMEEKMMQWVLPMLSVLYTRLGKAVVDLAVMDNNITLQPLESIKGMSYGRNTWVIADECEDCDVAEIKSIVTRSGGAKMILCGDVTQSCIRASNGLSILTKLIAETPGLREVSTHIDFDSTEHIVRSKLCKELIIAYEKLGI